MPWDPRQLDPDWPFDLYATRFKLARESTALLIVDMQKADVSLNRRSPVTKKYPAIARYWNDRLESTVVPNTRKLLAAFRKQKLKIVYTRNGQLTSTGDEMAPRIRQKTKQPAKPCLRPSGDIDPRLAPRGQDLVITKLTSGSFTATPLDHALRNMGVKSLVIAGILTDMCILGTARAAAELGYDTLICEDACASLTQRAHDEALLMHARVFGRVADTRTVLGELKA